MRVCIVSAEHSPYGGIGSSLRRQSELLASRHDVTFLERPEPRGEVASISFACEDHQRSAAVLDWIEETYGDGPGPDYLEVCDYRALGLVPLQARAAAHPLLRDTTVGVRVASPAELLALHDGTSMLPAERRVAELEREQFRLADLLLWPGGDILDVYRRYYGEDLLPPAVRVGRPFPVPPPPDPPPPDPDRPLRILYAGRLQRLKGVLDLVEACLRLPRDDWELTLIGADTETAPMGQSVRLTIEAICGGDPRVRIEDALPHDELQQLWIEHDLLVVASHFEICANVALEAMRAGLPVLSTPVGGQTGIVHPGVNGWLTDGVGVDALGRALGRLLEDREEVARVRASGEVFESFLRFTDPQAVLDIYEEVLARPARTPASVVPEPAEEPLVTAVIPYYDASRYIEETVASLLSQTHRNLEVLIVNDGSFSAADTVLDDLARDPRVRVVAQLNRGDLTARNLGIRLAEGDYVLLFDADNLLAPEFVARALAMLRADPALAYVTCWLRLIGPENEILDGRGYAPLGNRVLAEEDENWDGDTAALFPGHVLTELDPPLAEGGAMQGDWLLYRRLRERGRYGAVIPDPLVSYRVHPDSMLRTHGKGLHERSWDEGRDWRRLRETRWTAL